MKIFDQLKLYNLEKIILFIVLYFCTLGVLISYIDVKMFDSFYVLEDGMIEWLSALFLLFSCFVCIYRYRLLKNSKPRLFLICTVLGAAIFFFGFGEEISWGQRQLGYVVPKAVAEKNTQAEMNFHNLVIGGVKINKAIFGTGLGIIVGIYMLILPVLYSRYEKVKKKVDSFAIPLPRLEHILSYLFLFFISCVIPTGKKGELLEFGGTAIYFLILVYPLNKTIFNKNS